MNESVSVIMPTYNRNELVLSRSLPSILNQTYGHFEVIIVADGMDEQTILDLGEGIEKIGDNRVSLWNIERQKYPEDPVTRWCVLGLNARNFALDMANGDWIASLDDDDAWHPSFLEVMLDAAISTGSDFAYCRSKATLSNGDVQLYGHWPPGHFAFCDGSYVYRNGMGFRYDPECFTRGLPEDGDLWDRMVDAGVTFTFVNDFYHYYYPNPR